MAGREEVVRGSAASVGVESDLPQRELKRKWDVSKETLYLEIALKQYKQTSYQQPSFIFTKETGHV